MISAARSAGCGAGIGPVSGALSLDFTRARPSSMRSRAEPVGQNFLQPVTTFSAVKSCCTSSGTTSSPAIRLTMANRGTFTRGFPSM